MAIKEIYCKKPSERGYKRKLETDDEEEIIIQQIKMLLGTKHGDVLGCPGFGIDLQQFLFGYNNTIDDIKTVVNNAISYFIRYDRDRYSVYCDVRFGKDTDGLSEYALIDIIINEKKYIGILIDQD